MHLSDERGQGDSFSNVVTVSPGVEFSCRVCESVSKDDRGPGSGKVHAWLMEEPLQGDTHREKTCSKSHEVTGCTGTDWAQAG